MTTTEALQTTKPVKLSVPDRDTALKAVVIENVQPQVDHGRFAIKRTSGETVAVEADVFTDGHDQLRCLLRHRHAAARDWSETPMTPLGNDRWWGEFTVVELGRYEYQLTAWVDAFLSWRHDFVRRNTADEEEIALALQAGATLVRDAVKRAPAASAKRMREIARSLTVDAELAERRELALGEELSALMSASPDRGLATTSAPLAVVVEPERARFSSWYELFPRSCGPASRGHGTFADCEAELPRLAAMGFDVLYLPPIHPIGRIHRKGRNNALVPKEDDPGSPWAIGADEGGHKAVHPQLGTLADFRHLVAAARAIGIEVALDIALQCAPDHPYVKEHPEWFRRRPDGSVQYAENPPKKYEDIYPFNFASVRWSALWEEVKSIFEFWIAQGVCIFRVDNPHTKPFALWEWLIAEIKRDRPEVIFLSEAFTRPRVMHRLAKLGFSQSYTYFTWRNTKAELTEYFTELTATDSREYFRPNAWPNTPDILHEYLQIGGRSAFMTRLVLAATLAANYGIYGPAYELCENRPREPGSEEYLDSEKYEIKHRDLDRPDGLRDFITRVNAARRDNPALRFDWNLHFHRVDNPELICYSKVTRERTDAMLMVVNLDWQHTQSGWVDLDLELLGIDSGETFQVHDLLGEERYLWQGPRNYVELNPQVCPAHIFRVRRRLHTERDFDYFA
ncbi:MAG TPA: alpha-1,4-glucan--maltose-1-phosphate maltosyltransferase [Casimicrobiaceae bacterium]